MNERSEFSDEHAKGVGYTNHSNTTSLDVYWLNWNNRGEAIPGTAETIIEMINRACVIHANREALIFKGKSISYKELYERSNRMAHYLISAGLQPGGVVGVALERGMDLVVAILGVLKAGGVFLPLDPQYASERIEYMLENAEAQWLLTSSGFRGKLQTGAKEICVNDIGAELLASPAGLPDIQLAGTSLAYILYTSGSTGKPKGVMIANASLVNYIGWAVNYYLKGTPGVFPLYTSISFDLTITSIFSPLVSGNLLKIYEDQPPVALLEQIFTDSQINVVKLTPSHLRLVRDNSYIRENLTNQRLRLIVGGEDLETSLCKEIDALFKQQVAIYNEYGPTEATVGCMIYEYQPGEEQLSVPIGIPIANTRIYLLDQEFKWVPKGVPGEIFIAGDAVAEGYYNNLQLTQERFLADPFAPGGRMYKTGDIAVMLDSDVLVFKGRTDDQIKLRGYRIELGEIENRLLEIEGVQQAAVIAKERQASKDKYIAAYFTKKSGAVIDVTFVREALKSALPEYMIPDFIIELEMMPLTSNGKADKKSLPEADESLLRRGLYVAPVTDMELQLAQTWQELLGFTRIGVDDNFFEFGGNSLLAQNLVSILKTKYDFDIPITKLYQHPSIAALQKFLKGERKTLRRPAKRQAVTEGSDIAVIGMECNFPGATTIESFWDMLVKGKETTSFFSPEEIDRSIPESEKNNPSYVRARGILEQADYFDAAFFGISPRLAELMDPQQRLFLETSRNLLEKTGYLPDKTTSVTGVFAGCATNSYFTNNVVWHKDKIATQGSVPVVSVSDKDFISSRVSYQLNLSGPAVNVNTACSTSLVAIIQAVESLRSGQCDTAIAGGAAITSPINSGHLYEEGAMFSPDGHCRPFDADAKGTVFSDGVGAVLLKRVEDAIKDGDTIYAVIKGVGINNDGGNKGSFTAPSAEGQAAAVLMALDDAKVHPAEVAYIEAHGTATPLGDPIEVEGLKLAFGKQDKRQYCAIGSVKGNFGHLTHAAGVAGFIKTVLSLHHRQLPASLNFTQPNPHIDFASSPFIVNDALRNWDAAKPIAGVSSFGVGGTNAHVVLQAFETVHIPPRRQRDNEPALIGWSAHVAESTIAYAKKLHNFLLANPVADLGELAYTIHSTRQDLAVRNFIVAKDTSDLVAQLANTDLIAQTNYQVREKNNNVVFLFPGQGNQYPNMGRELYDNEEVYRDALDACADILEPLMNEDIRDIIFADDEADVAAEKLKNTRYAQPAIFATSYALAKLYMSLGITPVAFAGHSVGEFVGAHLSGIFSLEDVLRIVAERGRLISELPAGSMLSVRASQEKVKSLLPTGVSVAAQNATDLCVVSGEKEVIEKFAEKLDSEGLINKPLKTSHAFHSAMMDPIVPLLKAVVETATLQVPQIPIMSTVTAAWLTDSEATSPDYWANHARETVNFGQALKHIQQDFSALFLEAGPGTSSTIFVNQNGLGSNSFPALSMTTLRTGEAAAVRNVLGKLWQRGVDVNWSKIYEGKGYHILQNVPTYAYNKKRFWVDPPAVQQPQPLFTEHQATDKAIGSNTVINTMSRKSILLDKLKETIESASGLSVADADPNSNFSELGLDSLLLTQLTTSLKKEFSMPVTFRQLSENYDSLNKLAAFYDASLPPHMFSNAANATQPVAAVPAAAASTIGVPATNTNLPQAGGDMLSLMSLQLQLLTQQVAMMQQGSIAANASVGGSYTQVVNSTSNALVNATAVAAVPSADELTPEEKSELKKPFGATARIDKKVTEMSAQQEKYIANFIAAYNRKTAKSKAYTQKHRAKMADPRVVSGFRPHTKEIVYSIVTNKSKGCYLWDLDGNKYIDALNGFGSNFLGYQPDFIKSALLQQVEDGYETGPQHELAGEVADLICELTGMERAGLCNTGSEAVLGAMRIARTVSGKDLIVAFSGSYHGITDEVLVRGSKKLKTYPAAPGILADNVQNMLILEYGSEDSLKIIKERASEIAAVLVEPVQSRRPEFVPVAFLRDLRALTASVDVALIFDEVITGFRSHLGGIQALFGIKADLATYGKVAGAGISIGIIAGSKKYMDALDGGYWAYGDDSIPEVGVTYFAGTFVRHPLALATTKAALTYLKEQGNGLQKEMNEKTERLVARLTRIINQYRVPIYIVHFSSLWKIKFKEEYPYYELLFALMRLRNIHIWDLFPCYLTIAHTPEDIDGICVAFEESIAELCQAGFIPQGSQGGAAAQNGSDVQIIDNSMAPVPGAKLGKDRNGHPAWFAPDEKNPGKYLQISLNDQ